MIQVPIIVKKIEEFKKKKEAKLVLERCLLSWIWRRRIRKLKEMKRKADEAKRKAEEEAKAKAAKAMLPKMMQKKKEEKQLDSSEIHEVRTGIGKPFSKQPLLLTGSDFRGLLTDVLLSSTSVHEPSLVQPWPRPHFCSPI